MPLPLTITLSVIGGLLILFAIAFLILIAPGEKRDIEKYRKVKFAHRGLHNEERAENSMSAFSAAVEAGFGIELDVRLSSDGVLVVFHDDTLNRVAGVDGRVDAFTADELSAMSLS
ncbi:MAG: glycerophosphodiester phosphodiesterase, partial [Oscillospiraceae bacterium]|nr:glycerophosphodiester phosphodiesterase [Oscillospiraceae bacterium]